MIRAILQSIKEGVIKRFTASGRSDETLSDREYIQHYGFTSSPLPGAEGVIMNEGNHYIMIATDDRRYRIPIVSGEVCLYTDEGDNIRFQRGKQITITSGNKLVANVTNEADVTAPVVTITAATSCQIVSPVINLGGDRAGLLRLMDERMLALFNSHYHAEHDGGNTGTPIVAITAAGCCTSVTEAK